MRYVASTVIGLLAGFSSIVGQAETTATTSFQVGAHIQSSCRVQSEDLRFLSLSSAESQALNASATLSVHCTRGTYGDIRLGPGMQPAAESEHRRLSGEGGRSLGYRLQLVRGEASPGEEAWDTVPAPLVSDDTARRLTLHGRLDQAPDSPGLLTDTVTVTLVY
ncbi:spore coat protein U domain-containing protein [Saccharospirillum salsuginis]|uniref:Spore coat protein U/FanG domain-containing protein n=1 Tax=Saccharospirillum salsuginis TaxID=418750 RepID=A0A918N4X7_9GAMM|nr:spore coat protein U domain-containing protein [Saccharospirillum salsuginis]GGX39621.1 hypothetical protein GCM10007392_02600 [Saccharospirillum salsuginis]